MTSYNVIHQLTPQLYLPALQMRIYTGTTITIFSITNIYYIICVVRIFLNRHNIIKVNQSTRDIRCVGDTSTSFLLGMSIYTHFFFIVTLSFKLIYLAAFLHTIMFTTFTSLVVMLITRYQSFDKTFFDIAKIHPKLTATLRVKAFIINILQFLLGLMTLVTTLTLGLTLGNSFYVKTSTVLFSSMNFFFALFLFFFIIIESLLTKYMKVQFGYHIGILVSLIMLFLPILAYETLYANEYFRGIISNIACMFIVWAMFFILRVIRFMCLKSKYQLIIHEVEDPLDVEETLSTS